MNLAVKRKIEVSEPVQWAIDFLENMINLYYEEDLAADYWERLLKEKKRELLEDFYALTPAIALFHQGLGYCEGLDGGRMLVMRILMDILPPYQAPGSYSGKCIAKITDQLKTFEDVLVYLKSLHLVYEGDGKLWKSAFFSAVKMLLHNNYSPYLFHRGGWPAFIVTPPYCEQTTACYLFNPHIIVLYSLPEKNKAKRIYLILHEVGHLIFEKYLANKPLPKTLITTLAKMEPSDYPELFCPSSQGIAEIFANLFALAVMYETKEGKELFHHYYCKMGKTALLLQKTFLPGSILQTAAPTQAINRL